MSFGIEIEFLVPSSTDSVVAGKQLAQALTDAGIPTYSTRYTDHQTHAWKLKPDGSIDFIEGYHDFELVSPPMETNEASFDLITKACAVLSLHDATVNSSCGLHVHIGARALSLDTMKHLAILYAEYEPVIDSIMPPSRRGLIAGRGYCRSIAANVHRNRARLDRAQQVTEIAAAANGADENSRRRHKVNFAAYWLHGTVEFRHHSGTVDPAKIIAWVKFVHALMTTAAALALGSAIPASAPTGQPNVGDAAYWQRGVSKRVLFEMLTRPEGVTGEELRVRLGLGTRPNIAYDLQRAGAPTASSGRRGGAKVFRLSTTTPTPAQPAPREYTLTALLAALNLSESDRVYWTTRAAALAGRNAA